MTTETTDGVTDPKNLPVAALCLGSRARRRIALLNVETLEDLIKYTADDLREIRGFGAKCLLEVREKLLEHHLKLKED